MTDDGALLLKSIIANPDDDVARLVYADYLQEQGQDDRAELIRVQIESARVMPGKHQERCNCKGCQLRAREDQLLREASNDYRFPTRSNYIGNGLFKVPTLNFFDDDQIWFRVKRGFVEELFVSPDVWLKYADSFFRQHYPIRTVSFTRQPPLAIQFPPPQFETTNVGVIVHRHAQVSCGGVSVNSPIYFNRIFQVSEVVTAPYSQYEVATFLQSRTEAQIRKLDWLGDPDSPWPNIAFRIISPDQLIMLYGTGENMPSGIIHTTTS